MSAQDSTGVEVFQGAIINSHRVVGMGGAFVGVAEDTDGTLVNPASLSVRQAHNGDRWFNFDLALQTAVTSSASQTELTLSGIDAEYDSARAFHLGVGFRFANFGIGVQAITQNYDVAIPWEGDGDLRYRYAQTYGGLGVGYTFVDPGVSLGVVFATGNARFDEIGGDVLRGFEVSGGGLILGGLWTPWGQPYRLGLTIRTPIFTEDELVLRGDETFELRPDRVEVPFELALGGSYMFGERPYNVRPTYLQRAERRADLRSQRRALLLCRGASLWCRADIGVVGQSERMP